MQICRSFADVKQSRIDTEARPVHAGEGEGEAKHTRPGREELIRALKIINFE